MRTIDLLADLIGDTNYPGINAFGLDYAEQLSALDGLSIDDLKLTELSATRIEARAKDFTLVLSGGQLSPVATLQELLSSIDRSYASGVFSELALSAKGVPILTFTLLDGGFVFRSGEQEIRFVAEWPQSLSDLFERVTLLIRDGEIDLGAETLRQFLDESDVQGFTILDKGTELIRVSARTDEVSVNAEGLSFAVKQTQSADTLHLELRIAGSETSSDAGEKSSSANLSGLSGRVPELADALELILAPDEIARIEALIDHTYVNYSLDQSADGPFDFVLNARIDHFFTADVMPAIKGTGGADWLIGSDGDDLFLGLDGSDTLDGGAGVDAARYYGFSAAHRVELYGAEVKVLSDGSTGLNTDILRDIETIHFDDLSLDVALYSKRWDDIPQIARDIVELYIGYFDRAPDAAGALFWIGAHLGGMSLDDISEAFFHQPEAAQLRALSNDYGNLIDYVYANVLGRAADADGKAFWSKVLHSKELLPSAFVLNVLEGARSASGSPADAQRLSDLTDLGLYFSLVRNLSDATSATAVLDYWDGRAEENERAFVEIENLYEASPEPSGFLTLVHSDFVDIFGF